MAGTRKLVIEIVGNAKDATKAFGDVRSASDRTRERLNNFGTAALGIGTALAGGLAVAVGQFVEADTQSRKLDNSIANSTQTFTNNGEALRTLADEMQRKTAADGDAVISAESLLVQFGLTEDQIKSLVPLTVDLSRKMGVDMDTAARAVGKAMNGSAGALSKMGIQVDAAKLKVDPLNAVMEALQQTVGGFAEGELQTASGQFEHLKVQLGDLVEAVGAGAYEVFGPLVGGISDLVSATGDGGQKVATFGGKVAAIAAAALIGVGGIVKVKGAIDSAKDSFTNGAGQLNNLGKAMKGVGMVAGAVALYALVDQLNRATVDTVELKNAIDELAMARNVEQLAQSFANLSTSGRPIIDKLRDFFGRGAEMDTFANMSVDAGGLSIKLRDVERNLLRLQESGDTEGLANAMLLLTKHTTGSDVAMRNLSKIIGPYQEQARNAAARTKDHAGAQKANADATKIATDALREQVDQLKAMTDPIFAVMNATDGEAKAQAEAAAAQAEVTRLRQAGQTGTDAYRQAVDKANASALGSVRASVEAESAITSLAAGVRDGSVSTAAFSDKLAEYVRTGRISQGTADILALKVGGVNNQLRNIPARVGSRVSVDTANASNNVSALQRRINNLRAALSSVGILTAAGRRQIEQQLANAQGDLPGQADGGPVLKGRPYLVGERGPEIVIPGSGYVIPNRELVSAPAAMSGGGGVTVNVTTGVGDAAAIGREVVRVLKAYERTSGTGWRQ